jgi:hypothetical protein
VAFAPAGGPWENASVTRDETPGNVWKPCNVCKKPIALGATYWVCSVSTCNRKRTGLSFCSVSCWDAHLPFANHRESWAVEETAPATREAAAPPAVTSRSTEKKAGEGKRRIVRPAPNAAEKAPSESNEVLIIASRLKDFIRAESGFNVSDRVVGPLSDIVRKNCRDAIRNARRDERKTVLDRDIPRE